MPSRRHPVVLTIVLILIAATFPVSVTPASASAIAGVNAGYSPGWKILWGSDDELARDLDGMVATGAKWIRVDFDWPSIQPSPETWRWHATDRVVREATKRGMHVLALPTYTPAWQRPAGTSDKHAPRDPAAYAAFVRAAAERYAPEGVRHWEIWNEANIVNFWQPKPDPVAYARLLEGAAAAIRAVDPGATVITSGTAPAADTADGRYVHPATFLRTIYQQGGKDTFDAVAHHPYSFPVEPLYNHRDNAFWGVTPQLRDLMVANGDSGKEIWGTEFGAPTGSSSRAVTRQEQGEHLVEAYTAWSSWSWTGPLLWYNWRDTGTDSGDVEQNFGLITEDFRAKPALASMTGLFAGTARPPSAPTTPAPTTTEHSPRALTEAPERIQSGQLKRLSGSTRFDTAVAVAADSNIELLEEGTGRQLASYPDIPGHAHERNIETVTVTGIAGGFANGTFAPNAGVTRGQMAAFLARTLGLSPVAAGPFSDVAATTHAGSIGAVAAAGIAGGFPDGTYRPNAPVSRGQMASFLASALELAPVATGPFSDVAGTTHAGSINAVAQRQVAGGFGDGTFRPDAPVNRGQMASFIVRGFLSP